MEKSEKRLNNALNKFLTEALNLRKKLAGEEALDLSVEDFANKLTDLDSLREVNAAGAEAAEDNRYLRRKKRAGQQGRRAGPFLVPDPRPDIEPHVGTSDIDLAVGLFAAKKKRT
jgi:hypothetical protein